MGRGKVVLKRIENKINRQVTFAKRRNGLLKKAYELSVLCDAEVALIIFSTRGKLYEFCSSSSMLKTLERYHKVTYEASNPNPVQDNAESYQEYLRLKSRVKALDQTQRTMLGEDLAPLSIKELEQLENQLEISLGRVRTTKTDIMLNELSNLQIQEERLREANRALRIKIDESTTENRIRVYHQTPQTHTFFHPLECNSTLQIGFNHEATQPRNAQPQQQNYTGFLPGWML
nr:MADS transcription factor [Consolida ajacis]